MSCLSALACNLTLLRRVHRRKTAFARIGHVVSLGLHNENCVNCVHLREAEKKGFMKCASRSRDSRGFVRARRTHLQHISCSGACRGPVNQESTSLWLATSVSPKFETLRKDVYVDVAIVGA